MYFGLPSGGLYDVIEWLPYLDEIIAVERDPDEKRRMARVAFGLDIMSRLQILDGNIDDVLIEGVDSQGNSPATPAFDLVNLDYYSGLIMKDFRGNSRHVQALKGLLRRQSQARQSFRLFVTANVRDRDKGELEEALDSLEEEISELGLDPGGTIEWYREQRFAQKMKIYFPRLLSSLAVAERLSVTSYVPVYYGSGSTHLMHFACYLECETQLIGRPISPKTLLLTPLRLVADSKIVVIEEQPPYPTS